MHRIAKAKKTVRAYRSVKKKNTVRVYRCTKKKIDTKKKLTNERRGPLSVSRALKEKTKTSSVNKPQQQLAR